MPERTCLGCRSVRDKGSLVRLAAGSGGAIEPDMEGRLGGRGAYICPDEACLRQALRKGAFNRALRIDVRAAGPEELWALVQGALAPGKGA